MAIRQYIGARYTTKIYENSLDPSSAEWEPGVTYEPLTMVTYLNSSYLSKKEVPGPTGNPASNPEYWVLTGAYNGQILNLQNQIDNINNTTIPAVENEIDEIRGNINPINRKYLIICDSYGNDLNSENRNFYSQAFHELGISDYYDFHRNSAGFSKTGSLNFLAVLQDNESAISDKTSITDIIVIGGANDQSDTDDIASGIAAFMSYVKSEYANARVFIGHFTNAISVSAMSDLKKSIRLYKEHSNKNGAAYINNSEYVMAKLSFFDADAVHPSENGNRALTKYFEQYILNGSFDVYEKATNIFSARDVNVTLSGTPDANALMLIQNNGIITAMGTSAGVACRFNFTTPVSISTGVNLLANLLTATDGWFYSIAGNTPALAVDMLTVGNVPLSGNIFAYNMTSDKDSSIGMIINAPSNDTISGMVVNCGSESFALFEGPES